MNCKPGDMAVLVVSPYVPSARGTIVQVIELNSTNNLKGVIWDVVLITGAPLSKGRYGMPGKKGYVSDAWLRPIRPDETPVETTQSLTKKARV